LELWTLGIVKGFFSSKRIDVQIFYFLSGPRCSAKKNKTGFDAGIIPKTIYRNDLAQILPAVSVHQKDQDHFERLSVEWVIGLRDFHSGLQNMV
jgi:isocitrate lyase